MILKKWATCKLEILWNYIIKKGNVNGCPGQCLIIYLKKVFMGKKKQLMFWQFFPFHIKDVSKFFLNKLLTIILKAPVSMT